MAVSELISVEQYLNTTYRPDCDYVDGEVLERNLGERDHSAMQRRILLYLCTHFPEIADSVLPEQRVQVNPTRFRIPDICLLRPDAPEEQIVRTAPALCIEILSPEDRLNRTMQRLDDYFAMGVPVCWVIDPLDRRGWIALPGQWTEAAGGIMQAGDLEMPLAEVFPPAA
jgi:Uma2 family endonuclease